MPGSAVVLDLPTAAGFVPLNLLLVANGWRLRGLLHDRLGLTWSEAWLTFAAAVWAQVVVLQALLGYVGFMHYPVLLAVQAAVHLLLRRDPRSRAGTAAHLRLPDVSQHRTEAALLALGIGLAVLIAGLSALSPVTNYDSLTYHIAFPVEWYKRGELSYVMTGWWDPVPTYDPAPTYYPFNVELVFLWLLWPLRSTTFAELGQAPFILVGVLGTYGCARRLGATRQAGLRAAALAACTPMVLVNGAYWSYNDVAMGAAFVATLYAVLGFWCSPDALRALQVGVWAGLLVGSKGIAAVYVAPLALAVAWRLLSRLRRCRTTDLLSAGAGALVPAALLGLHTHARNALVAGNPLYPVALDVGPVDLPGIVTMEAYRAGAFYAFDLVAILWEPGYLPIAALTAVALAGMPLWHGRLRSPPVLHVPAGLAVVLLGLFMFVSPIRDVRFLVPVALLGCIVVAAMSEVLPDGVGSTVVVLAGGVGACTTALVMAHHAGPLFRPSPMPMSFTNGDWPRILATASTGAGATRSLAYLVAAACIGAAVHRAITHPADGRDSHPSVALVAAIALVGVATVVGVRDARGMWPYTRFYPNGLGLAWDWLDDHTEDAVIANVGNNLPLPLYGTGLQNEVVPAGVGQDALPHEGADGGEGAEQWMARLAADEVDYLLVSRVVPGGEVPREQAWAKQRPEVFEPVFEDEAVTIYRIDPESSVAGGG